MGLDTEGDGASEAFGLVVAFGLVSDFAFFPGVARAAGSAFLGLRVTLGRSFTRFV